MAKDKPAKYWRFKLDTRRKFTELSQEIARINSGGGGGGISELTSKMVVDALGYTPYNAANPANYITASALTPYLKTEDAEETYATKDFVNNKLVDYAPLTSVQGFENRIGGLEGAVPQLNERVTTVEGKVSSLNETVSTGENNLLDRVNTIETDYVTSGNLESAINGIDLSAYLLKADLTKSRIQSTLGISDWALSATKPSYAWSEINSRPTALSQFTDDVVAGKYLPLSGGNVASLTIGGNTASPTEKLHVAGNVKASGDITANKFIGYLRGDIIYDNGVDEGHFIGLGSNGVGVKGLLNYVYGNFPILFYTNGFERMRIGDYVGIGTTSPTERLDVLGNIKASGNINATSITINGVTITASNGSITVNGNVFATGDITGFV